MTSLYDVRRRSAWQIIKSILAYIDWWIVLIITVLMAASLFILHSTSPTGATVNRQILRFIGGWLLFIGFLSIPAQKIRQITPYLYGLTIVLLIAVMFAGVNAGGAKRWINIGIARLQPSEIAKLTVPLLVAWYVTRQARPPNLINVIIALAIIAFPTGLILIEPDLGTALLVAAAGLIALIFAGLPIWMMGVGGLLAAIGLPLFWFFGIKDYQRERVLTLFNPDADPWGAGYHIIQSKIAIGSGGLFGKGYMNGTQSQLDFLPESSTDFIFSVIAEEFGLIGVSILLVTYSLLIFRGLYLSTKLDNRFARIVVASIFSTFFINIFVNIGMVSGFLPVVGLPLAMISYGGSSVLSLMTGFALALNLIGGFKTRKEQEHL
ncbi:rod shape-determining protein RodA [Suttonella ornithocola]|uniref:Peptidoglycan glycosyltransferase MrdB n=1 Tax=Suttonella ornithocola TaxID=279832 RepID=A0A380MS32_9GAMM|nr:rod shape-determining protein RodA [Suttonella ornithocola]SUO95449.1 Rod shape-determining protein RodA [Suttonella ornithocola]